MILPMREDLTMSRVFDRRIYSTKNSQYNNIRAWVEEKLTPSCPSEPCQVHLSSSGHCSRFQQHCQHSP